MQKSFQTIFEEILERKSNADSSLGPVQSQSKAPLPTYTEPVFHFKAVPRARLKKNPYPAPLTRPLPKEVFVDKFSLNPETLAIVDLWTQLGATTLIEGINLKRVKKAYRQVALCMHPDTRLAPLTQTYNFTQLKLDLRKLEQALKPTLKDSARDSEFASAGSCPHPNAA